MTAEEEIAAQIVSNFARTGWPLDQLARDIATALAAERTATGGEEQTEARAHVAVVSEKLKAMRPVSEIVASLRQTASIWEHRRNGNHPIGRDARDAADLIERLSAAPALPAPDKAQVAFMDDMEEKIEAAGGYEKLLAMPDKPAPDKAQEEVAAAHEVQRIREAVMNGDTDWQTECTAAIEHNHALRRALSTAHASGREEGERAGLERAAKIADNATVGVWPKGVSEKVAGLIDKACDKRAHDIAFAIRTCLTSPTGPALPVPSPAQERGE